MNIPSHCSLYLTNNECITKFGPNYNNGLQDKIESPIPWIGMFTAAASAACSLAMAVDAVSAIRNKKLWVPCKYFSLNAFSLTVLAIAMKLPVDLTTRMPGINDKLSRVSSLVLMSTAIANFMPSLGSMEDNEIPLNLAALAVFVVTVAGNVFIHVVQLRNYYVARVTLAEKTASTVFALLLLVTLCSLAVMVPVARRHMESQYKQMHERIISLSGGIVNPSADELRVAVRKYWVMAESRALQFVVARSVVSATSGALSVLVALTLVEAHIRLTLVYRDALRLSSNYKWSVNWILGIQSAGVALGMVAPLLRWFSAARLKSAEIGRRRLTEELQIEAYWTQLLKDWRDRPLPLRTGHHRFRKAAHESKRLLLSLCIGLQILIIHTSKLILLGSAILVRWLTCCYDNSVGPDETNPDPDLNHYVLLLEGEAELPQPAVAGMCRAVDGLIETGKRRKFERLIVLLGKSHGGFDGVWEFDGGAKIRSLSSPEPPNCWALPLVTLTSIAVSVADSGPAASRLLAAVGQGLYFTRIIEKALDPNGKLAGVRNAAESAWVRLELYRKWQGEDLRRRSGALERLSSSAEKTVRHFVEEPANRFLARDPLNWPAKVIAANSMYRITRTLMIMREGENDDDDDGLFDKVEMMISDIVAACFTNLARVISKSVRGGEESMCRAALLLGECEEVLETLERTRGLPNVCPDKAATVDGWRAFLEQEFGNT
ncbi:hypothetical protein STAS_24913 [Striga asiatica]|uniref:Uncharacterized protein n=1 Tax=Striga asiatica TaxID=4170 RepID=A0A5A7QRE5_STRAF|nr:hypothetical protein STAS_24913 [Striga asiatica]